MVKNFLVSYKNKDIYMAKFKTKKSSLSLLLTGSIFFAAGCLTTLYGPQVYSFAKNIISQPKISVVMSTYNREHAIAGAVESILNQTMKDFELIVVNDGSTDKTQEILEEYAKKDDRLIVIKNEKNMGLVAGLNKGLDAARGKYIARMDDDDKSLPYRLERQFLAMETYPHITVLGAGFASGKEKMPTGEPKIKNPDEIELNTYFSSGLAHPTIIIRKEFLDKNNIRYDEKYLYAEDCGLYKKILEKGGKISVLQEPVLVFGYVKKVNKPNKYGYTQAESFKRLQQEKLAPFFKAPYEILGAFTGDINRCVMLKEMVKVNKEKKILNQEIVEKRYNSICPQEGEEALFFSHPDWGAFVIFDESKENIKRKDVPTETAKILDKSDNHITIKWKNYNLPETFIKIQGSEYKFTNETVLPNIKKGTSIYDIQHPHWTDKLIVLKDKTFYRFSLPTEKGEIIKETNNFMTIKWDNWPTVEIFKKDQNSLIFEKELKK